VRGAGQMPRAAVTALLATALGLGLGFFMVTLIDRTRGDRLRSRHSPGQVSPLHASSPSPTVRVARHLAGTTDLASASGDTRYWRDRPRGEVRALGRRARGRPGSGHAVGRAAAPRLEPTAREARDGAPRSLGEGSSPVPATAASGGGQVAAAAPPPASAPQGTATPADAPRSATIHATVAQGAGTHADARQPNAEFGFER
jgi:hypothetical protein